MAKKLKNLKITRVDLVDKGANYDPATGEGAHVLLYKRAVSKDNPGSGDLHVDTLIGNGNRVKADVGGADVMCRLCQSAVAESDRYCKGCGAPFYKKAAPTKETKPMTVKELLESIAKMSAEDKTALMDGLTDPGADVNKGLSPEAQARIAKLEGERAEDRAVIAKMVETNRLSEFTKAAEALPYLPGTTTAELGALLKDIADRTPEGYAKLAVLMKGWNEAISVGDLFVEKGLHGGDTAYTLVYAAFSAGS